MMLSSVLVGQIILAVYKFTDAIVEPTVKLFVHDNIKMEYIQNTSLLKNASFLCGDDDGYCLNQAISQYLVYYNVATRVTSILSTLIFGLVIRYLGYKVCLLISLSCSATAQGFYILISSLTSGKSAVDYLVSASIIHGLSGLSGVVCMILECLISEQTTNEERTKALSTLIGLKLFGSCLGSVASGLLVNYAGYISTFTLIFIISILVIMMSIFCLMEEKRDYSKLLHIKFSFDKKLMSKMFSKSGIYIASLIVIIAINQACISGGNNVVFLLATGPPLYFSKVLYTALVAVDFVALSFMVIVITPLLITRFEITDGALIIIGMLFNSGRWFTLSAHVAPWLLFLSTLIGCPGAVIVPGCKTIITKSITSQYLPLVLSVGGVFETLADGIGPSIFLFIYNHSISSFSRLVFIVLGITYLVIMIPVLIKHFWNTKASDEENLIITKEITTYDSNCSQPETEE